MESLVVGLPALQGASGQFTEVDLGDVVIFFDSRFPPDPGSGVPEVPAVNRIAVVVEETFALFLGRNRLGFSRVERLPLGEALNGKHIVSVRKPPFGKCNSLIVDFFRNSENDPRVFEAGLRALYVGNLPLLISGQLFPEPPVYCDDAEYLFAWERLKASLLPLDVIFTRDNQSSLSSFIAWSTGGPWSHVAMYVSDGEISESVTSGIRRVPIDIYKGRRYRVGVYRHIDSLDRPTSVDRANEIVSSLGFRPNSYNYFQAVRHGMRSFMGKHTDALVPNSFVYTGPFFLVAQA